MYVEQIYTSCLAEASYYVESNGEAAIIDPIREVQPYLDLATERGAVIKYVFETHFHADFVSGHVDLARKTAAQIVYGPGAEADYPIYVAEDGEDIALGEVKLRVLHTPGHTLESSCFLLIDETGAEHAVFTGDTLFIGDVGRPDLAANPGLSRDELASMLFTSLNEKLMPLDDHVVVYPGHGAGSQCGKELSEETVSTIGEQKKFNYALQESTREGFVAVVTDGILPPPQYFPKNAAINKKGYEELQTVMDRESRPLSVKRLKDEVAAGAMILDSRDPEQFALGHIPHSLNIGLDGFFAVWVGTIVEDLEQPMILVTPVGKEEETILRLARVGYENIVGYLDEGFAAWKGAGEKVSVINTVTADEFDYGKNINGSILDVRKATEFNDIHFSATNIPLADLRGSLSKLNKEEHYYVCCASGYRSMIASSILSHHGFKATNILGGMNAIMGNETKSCHV